MRLARAEPGKTRQRRFDLHKTLKNNETGWSKYENTDIKNKFQTNATLLPNDFIDNYMVNANGEFIKVYLFLLRHAEDDNPALTLSMIADCLNNTEKDILRALRYWESEGLLRSEYAADGKITSLELQSLHVHGLLPRPGIPILLPEALRRRLSAPRYKMCPTGIFLLSLSQIFLYLQV